MPDDSTTQRSMSTMKEAAVSQPGPRPGIAIADTIDDLTPSWFTSALQATGTLAPQVTVTSARSSVIGTGQLGYVARIELTYDTASGGGPPSVISKLPSQDAGSREMGAAMGVYEAEVRFYQEIAPLTSARVPTMYYGAVDPPTGRFTLLLEDLSADSMPGDMVAGGTVDQAALAIGELVALQAPLWNNPVLANRAWLDVRRTQMLFAAVAPALAQFLDRFADRLEPDHVTLVKQLAPKATSVTSTVWKPPFVVGHGDYRLDNMLFATGPAAAPIVLIDWQGARLAPPLLDAAIYLSACLTPRERRTYEHDLLHQYHARIVSAGVKGFTFEDCWASYRACSLYPLLLTVAVSITIAETERGDAMWARMLQGAAELVQSTSAAELLD
jgi:hypothetical protein